MSVRSDDADRDSSLARFVEVHHDALVERCRAKVASRSVPKPTDHELEYGIPLFLRQLALILRDRASPRGAMSRSAELHGGEMQFQGFTVAQVVHDYGDACQAITELAIELKAPISTEDFRTLNSGLDDAIADAVTEFARRREIATSSRDVQEANERLGILAHEIQSYAFAAMLAHEAMRKGSVGTGGSTSALLASSLAGMRDLVDNVLSNVRLAEGVQRVEPISVHSFLEGIEVSALLDAQARGLRFAVTPTPEDLTVIADRQILRSVVSNL
ncbi:MAG: ATP-binding protein, partial [Planctomycetota bacterium]